jgi:hypothetical protein
MSEHKHAKTPWKVKRNNETSEWIVTSPSNHVGWEFVVTTSKRDYESKANAAHIVKCVNAHEVLVAALKEIENYGKSNYGHGFTCSGMAQKALQSIGETL